MKSLTIDELFATHYCLRIADTPELLKAVYQLRYQVYSQEYQCFLPEKFPDGMEQDAYDRRSIHCLLQHRRSETFVGCVRIVLPDPANPEQALPFEKLCRRGAITPDKQAVLQANRGLIGEVSRLAVKTQFRTLKGRYAKALSQTEQQRKQTLLHSALGLCLAATSIAIEKDLIYACAVMELKLVRYLRRYGIYFQQVGEAFEHYGWRAPFWIERETLLTKISPACQHLFQKIRQDVRSQLVNRVPIYRASGQGQFEESLAPLNSRRHEGCV